MLSLAQIDRQKEFFRLVGGVIQARWLPLSLRGVGAPPGGKHGPSRNYCSALSLHVISLREKCPDSPALCAKQHVLDSGLSDHFSLHHIKSA